MNLFGETNEVIRTLGFYQPFGSLMLHGKIETRKVQNGRRPPFPFGKYLFYTTKAKLPEDRLYGWCGESIVQDIRLTLANEPTKDLHGYAIAIGELKTYYPMSFEDEVNCFVRKGRYLDKTTWCLEFANVQRIKPFEFKFGKQGVGFLPESEKYKIFLVSPE